MKLKVLFFASVLAVGGNILAQGDGCATAQNLGALPAPSNCPTENGVTMSYNLSTIGATAENPYNYLIDCNQVPGSGDDMDAPAADVWVSFIASGTVLDVTITSTMSQTNVALYQGACGSLTGLFCDVSTTGNLVTTFEPLTPGETYYLQISGGSETDVSDFTLTLENYMNCNLCVLASNLTATPPPTSGFYLPGTTVTFCLEITQYTQVSSNWMHGVIPSFGSGWDLSTLIPISSPGPSGSYAWFWGTAVEGLGWYVDYDPAGPGTFDGNFANNYGVSSINGNGSWTFCWQITTSTTCVNGASAGMIVNTTSDGESGSWTSLACQSDPDPQFNAMIVCCDIPLTTSVPPSCFGEIDGSATAQGQDGIAPYDYIWTDNIGTVLFTDNNNPGVSSLANLAAGIYTVTVTDNVGCVQIIDIIVADGVGPCCTAPNMTSANTASICDDGTVSINLTADVASTFTWIATDNLNTTGESTALQSTSTLSNTISNNSSTTQVVTYTVTPTSTVGACVGPTQNVDVTIFATPIVDPTIDVVVCDTYILPAITGTNLTGNEAYYTGTGGTGTIYTAGTTLNFSDFGLYPVTLFIYDQTGTVPNCSDEESFTLTINQTPDVDDPTDQLLCANTNTTLVTFTGSVPGTTYNWTNNQVSIGLAASGSGNIAAFNAVNIGTTPVVATITVTPVSNGCTGIPQTFTITVNPIPTVVDPANQTLCANLPTNAVTFTGSVAGTTFDWTNTDTSIGLAASGTGDIASFTAINTGITSVTSTITVTPTVNGCVGTPQTFTITVDPVPAFTLSSTDPTICGASDGTITFSGLIPNTNYSITYTGTGVVGPTVIMSNGTGVIVISGLSAGSYTTFTVTLGCTTIDASTINLVDPNASAISAGPDQTVCAGTSVTLTATNPDSTPISWDNGVTDGVAFVPAVGTIIYTVTSTLLGCTSSDQVTVTVNPIPTVTDPADQVLCANTNTSVTFAGGFPGTTFNWTNTTTSIGLGAIGSGNISSFTALNTGATPVVASITVTPTLAGCTGTAQTFTITVNPLPTFTLSSVNPTTCGGTNGTITISGLQPGTSYNVTYTATGVVGPAAMVSSGTGTITISGLGAGSYTNFIVSLLGCSTTNSSVINLTNPANPGVGAGLDQTVCEGTSVTLTATNPDGAVISWNNGVTNGVSFSPAVGSLSYTVTATLSGCTNTDIVTVTVIDVPVVNVNPAGPFTVADGTQTITSSPAGGTWSADCGACINSVTGVFNPATAGIGSWEICYTAGTAPCQVTECITIIVTSNCPMVATVTSNPPSCFGFTDGSISLNVVGQTGTPVFIIVNALGTQLNGVGSNVANNLQEGWYYYQITDATACEIVDSLFLEDPGQMTIDLNITQPTCYGITNGVAVADTVYNYNGSYNQISYFWNPNPSGTNGLGQDSLENIGAGSFNLIINDVNGCSESFDFVLTYPDSLYLTQFGFEPAYCRIFSYQNGNGVVYAAASGGTPDYTYLWQNLQTGATSNNSTWGGLNPGNYQMTVTDDNGCTLVEIITVDSLNPIADFTLTSPEFTANYEGNAVVNIHFENQSTNYANPIDPNADTTFFWNFGFAGEPWILSEDVDESFDRSYIESGLYTVCLVALNKNGCSDTMCVPVNIYDALLFVPINVFSPDGDGVNDIFTFNDKAQSIEFFECTIVDRWGVKMFEMDDITDGWLGTDAKGHICPDGVYFYTYTYTSFNGIVQSGQGTVQVINGK